MPRLKPLNLVAYRLIVILISLGLSQFTYGSDQKPFAEKHLILQLSDADPSKYTAILDISNNLIKHYKGPDFIDIEVIGFGRGVEFYFTKINGEINPNGQRISSLIANGIRFYVCLNTLDTIQRKTGVRPELLPGIIGVQTGVAFMLEEVTNGYTHIHP
ncbi:MAG: intracellular sulfur oxidation DsrE/DsrF family protein [Candidatus Azotimanducaceae bacterium]|jgi:intracellular sulfur oxidation DsrE/DsrF family protein